VLAIWVAIALAAAAILLRRRDAWLTPLPNGRFPSVELARALPMRGLRTPMPRSWVRHTEGVVTVHEWLSATI
jgi:hypothetical protein